jgi:DNA-binding beta-propeller fold protein YncE
MGPNKIAIGISVALLLFVALIYWMTDSTTATVKFSSTSAVSIEDTWELPRELAEISGMAFLGEGKIVGVQDEQGVLFIYDLNSREIEKRVKFGPNGDYEGVALDGTTAYVLRTDGTIIVVRNYLTEPEISDINTFLTQEEDPEGLCFDKKNKRLLIAIKGDDPRTEDSKTIYGFNISEQVKEAAPVFNIDLNDLLFKELSEPDLQERFRPSEINIHPGTGKIYLLEGRVAKLLIMSPEGMPEQLFILDKKDFPQPEGLTFDPDGNVYISNEGSPATIHRISIK